MLNVFSCSNSPLEGWPQAGVVVLLPHVHQIITGVPAQRTGAVRLSAPTFLQRNSKKDFHSNPSRGFSFEYELNVQ
jgi:hypothetical protein